ncbi:unnamed protein product [Cunninghamella blakesleeana]
MDIPSPSDKCELPKHIPIDMGVAPMKQPYEQQHTLHIGQESNESHLAQHSLSPEKLGVVGYVRDVAGFVKDAVHDVKQKHHSKNHQEQITNTNNTNNNTNNNNNDNNNDNNDHQQENNLSTTTSIAPQSIPNQHQSTPLADVVTSLFPNIGNSPKDNASPPCTHAESLRENMMEQMHYSKEHRLL